MAKHYRETWLPLLPGLKSDEGPKCTRISADPEWIENYHHTVLVTPERRTDSGVLLPIGSYVLPRPCGPRIPSEFIDRNYKQEICRPSNYSIVFVDKKYGRLSTEPVPPLCKASCKFKGICRTGNTIENTKSQPPSGKHRTEKRKKQKLIRVKCS